MIGLLGRQHRYRKHASFLVVVALASCLCSTTASAAPPANVERVETFRGVARYRLKSNGTTILLAPDRTGPVFTFMVVYHVGSRNEAPGSTGAAHLLEHLIFNKSTENFGKAHGHPTFQDVLYEAGDASSNMTTWNDRMNGYSTLPADKPELAMRIEADRMQRALLIDSNLGSNAGVAAALVNAEKLGLGPKYVDEFPARIRAVTTAQANAAMRRHFAPEKLDLVVAADLDAVPD